MDVKDPNANDLDNQEHDNEEKLKIDDDEEPVEHVSDIIGDYGMFQRLVAFFHCGVWIFSAYQALGMPFYAPDEEVTYECAPDAIRLAPGSTTDVKVQLIDTRCQCDKWVYNSTFYSTIITEWDLVCDRAWLTSFAQSTYMAGMLVTSLFSMRLADLFGRKRLFVVAISIEVFSGICASQAQSITQFIVARFFIALGGYARGICGFTLLLETLGPKSRTFWTIFSTLFWCIGMMTLPVAAYYLRNFRYLVLMGCLPHILTLMLVYWLPESPRWLLVNGHYAKAKALIEFAAKMNGKYDDRFESKFQQLTEHIKASKKVEKGQVEAASVWDLFKAKNVRRSLFIMYLTWFTHGLIYYGLSLHSAKFGLDLFISFFMSGLAEIPSLIVCLIAIKYFGRRILTSVHVMGAGLAVLSFVWIGDSDMPTLKLIMYLTGKFMIGVSYSIIYLVAGEVFPTVLRATAIGTCTAASRVGSILAPFIKELAQFTSMKLVFILLGSVALIDGILVLQLPETRDKEMPDTVEEAEHIEEQSLNRERRRSSVKDGNFIALGIIKHIPNGESRGN